MSRNKGNSTRRHFLKSAALSTAGLGAGVWLGTNPRKLWGQGSPMEEIQFACIGVGGKGKSDSADAALHGKVVAICDVDQRTLDQVAAQEAFQDAKKFHDFRELFAEMGDQIDAVTVSTPDHTHAVIASMAMNMGKHCFCQKPLTHSIYEARFLSTLAKEKGVKTQMGNQGAAIDNVRRAAEVLKKRAIGRVKEIHVWSNRPVWPQGIERPAEEHAVPEYLHWDEWLGPAQHRPYAPAYHPFKWRGWWDFGTGALGDMGCHMWNFIFMGLNLRDPIAVASTRPDHNGETFPGATNVTYEFPELNGRESLTMFWYDGGNMPSDDLFNQEMMDWLVAEFPDKEADDPKQLMTSGVLVIGEEGKLFSSGDYGEHWTLIGAETPEVEIVRSPGHFTEFADAIEGGPDAVSNFPNYAGPLTEFVLLGNLAVWAGKRVEWDAQTMTATNAPELQSIVKPEYRDGYSLQGSVLAAT